MGSEEDSIPDEFEEKLGRGNEVSTLLKLSVGPFVSQISSASYGFVNTVWQAKCVSEASSAALSASLTIDYSALAFGFFLSASATSKIASLFGEKRHLSATSLVSDMLRCCLVIGILLPATLLPVSKPLMRWFGSSEEIVNLGFTYLVPVIGGSFFTCVYLTLCGCLQAEGRTIMFAVVQLVSIVLNAAVFNPLFLIVFKMGIAGSSWSLVLSQAIPAIYLFIIYFRGNCSVKPLLKDFCKGISPDLFSGLKIGLPSLISGLSSSLPSIVFQKFIGMASKTDEEFNTYMSVYNGYARIFQIVIGIYLSITQGLLPLASYSYCSGSFRRMLMLILHSLWMTTVVAVVFLCILFGAQDPIARTFSSNAEFIYVFKDCLVPYFVTTALNSYQYIGTTVLQATQSTVSAFICTLITQMILFPMYTVIIYNLFEKNNKNLFYAMMCNDITSVIVTLIFCIPVLICVFRENSTVENESTELVEL